jgi:hypothetical protein
MAVTLLRAYGGFAANAIVTFPDATEQSLIAQGLATASLVTSVPSLVGGPDQFVNQGGNLSTIAQGGQGTPVALQGPSILPNISLGTAALTAVGASSINTTGAICLTEIFVPHWNTWKGLAVLNGTVASADNVLVALYGSDGKLLANSAIAGTVASGASTFQNRDFLVPVTLAPGRYFGAYQSAGATATTNRPIAANGVNLLTGSIAGTFGTVPATVTVPTTFTTAQGFIFQLYT